jgi:hypothetical protein
MISALTDVVTPAGLIVLFGLAKATARYTITYRRNNVGICFSLALFAAGAYLWAWLGVSAFVAGIILGGWVWVSSIRSANDHLRTARRVPAPSAQLVRREP